MGLQMESGRIVHVTATPRIPNFTLRATAGIILALTLAVLPGMSPRAVSAHPGQQRNKGIIPALAALTAGLTQAPPSETQVAWETERALEAGATARVIVALWPPAAAADAHIQKQELSRAQNSVLRALSAGEFRPIHRYQTIPGLVGVVTPQGLDSLRRHPDVRAVALDMPVHATLAESAALIRADRVWNDLGLTGAGVNVGILDSGVDLVHPDLSDDIVAQHCFNRGACPPNGTDEGEGAQDENGHGTRVAGVITGRGSTSPRGIAPDAGIVAVRVLDGSGSGWTSDVVAGIDWIVANQADLNVKIINLSLGGGRYSGVCDTQNANTMLYAAAVTAAREAGIITFAASGNSGLTDRMTAPACISGVVSVGSTYDADLGPITWPTCADASTMADQVACFSNSSPTLDLLAPGALIASTGLGGGQASDSGTSISSPHAAAVAALMVQGKPNATPPEIETVLKDTGVPVTDRRNGRVTPRIDALAAVTHVISGHATVSLTIVPTDVHISAGATMTTEVQVDGVSNLYSADFLLTFDPAIVQVVDAEPDTSGEQIAVGALFDERAFLVSRNQVDNTAGVVEFAISLQGPAEPIEGTGAVAAITWQGQAEGRSVLTLGQTQLADPSDDPIPHQVESGTIAVYHNLISGVALLQGRDDHSGTTVFLTEGPCLPADQATDEPAPGMPSVVTDDQGHFEISLPPGGDDRCLWVTRHGYLTGQASSPQGDLGRITLPGGDVIEDDVINIFDLVLVCARYGSDDPAADVNADGVVNIFDLTVVAGNLGQQGPVANWQ